MNDWSTSAPLTKAPKGSYFVDVSLAAGDYQFKFGSSDWRTADFGMITTSQLNEGVEGLPLIPHGGNIRLTIGTPGIYRFELKQTGPANATFAVTKLSATNGS